MTTQQILLSILMFGTMNNITFTMDNNATNNHYSEEAIFQANLKQLREPIVNFVKDFQTWPKDEQNKIQTYHLTHSQGYYINGKPAASDTYDAKYGLGYYLDYHLTAQQITPFLAAIEHLKKQ